MKHILNNAAQGTDLPWVTLDENGVHYSGLVAEVSFTFGSVESHTKPKADAVVGDICYVGETPIGVVVIKEEDKVKIMSLFELNEDGVESPKYTYLDGDKSSNACSLYITVGTNQGDWYLPSKQEFEDMQWSTNKTAIQASLNSLGDEFLLSNGTRWTSSMNENEYWCWSNYSDIFVIFSSDASNMVRAFCEL